MMNILFTTFQATCGCSNSFPINWSPDKSPNKKPQQKAPTKSKLNNLTNRIIQRVASFLEREGLLVREGDNYYLAFEGGGRRS
jgi:hypothetical protein